VRLLPGFMGNPRSLVEESHEDGLLEHPVYTRPPSWRGLDVPEVLLRGDHAAIELWRAEQSLQRTAQRRPDLVHPSRVGEWEIVPAVRSDAGEILTLQRACWVQEALDNEMLDIPALHESLDVVEASLDDWAYYVVRVAGRLVGAVRGRLDDHGGRPVWDIGRVMVAPDLQGRGLGRVLLDHIQAVAPAAATSYSLFTGARSADNQRMYRKAGFSLRKDLPAPPGAVIMTKPVSRRVTQTPRKLGD
jgi:tRNA (guanine37-N1)-methyltransferase